MKLPAAGASRELVMERRAERVVEAAGWKQSDRLGALTLEWNPWKRKSLQASERSS
jgi:hypothetical protein